MVRIVAKKLTVTITVLVMLASMAVIPLGGKASASTSWQVISLGSLGDFMTKATDINNQNTIVGFGFDSSGDRWRPFFWEPSSNALMPLDSPGGQEDEALAINNNNKIVGYSRAEAGSLETTKALYWDSPTSAATEIPTPYPSQALDINDAGLVVGIYLIPMGQGRFETSGFIWNSVTGSLQSIPYGLVKINNSGLAAGDLVSDNPLVYDTNTSTATALSPCDIPGNIENFFASSINDSGDVTGYCGNKGGWIYTGGVYKYASNSDDQQSFFRAFPNVISNSGLAAFKAFNFTTNLYYPILLDTALHAQTLPVPAGGNNAEIFSVNSSDIFVGNAQFGGYGSPYEVAVWVPSTGSLFDTTAPQLGNPSWSLNPKSTSQTSLLTVPATDEGLGVAGGEYFIGDTDPGLGNGVAMVWDGTNLSSTFGNNLSAGVYRVSLRAEDNAGNWSSVLIDYLVVYDSTGPVDVVGKRSLVPTLANGDMLPGLNQSGQNDKMIFGFDVKYGTSGGIDPTSAFDFTYNTGSKCNSQNPINCHKTSFTGTSFNWLTVGDTNNSLGTIKGVATLTVDGVVTQVRFSVVARDGDRLTPVGDDTVMIKVFNLSDNPDTATPIYQVSGILAHGSSIKIQ
jgi:hypothetical protein